MRQKSGEQQVACSGLRSNGEACSSQTNGRGARPIPRAIALTANVNLNQTSQHQVIVHSPANATVRLARALGTHSHPDLFFCEGPRFIHTALDSPFTIQRAIASPDLTGPAELAAWRHLDQKHVPITTVSARLFTSLSRSAQPTGLAAILRQHWRPLPTSPTGVWLVASDISTPGNLGTIIRSAEGSGASGLIATGATVSPFDAATVRASMGSVFGLPIVAATWPAILGWCRKWGVTLVGTAPRGGVALRSAVFKQPVAIIVGSERKGLSAAHLADCDVVVTIPMCRPPDSLNVAVAAAIVMYEAASQHRPIT